MCCKTSKVVKEIIAKRKEDEDKKKSVKGKSNRRSFHSSDGESDKEKRRGKVQYSEY